MWNVAPIIIYHWKVFAMLIDFFLLNFFAGFLEQVYMCQSVEKIRKLIMKNRLDQRSRHFRDLVY